MAQCYLFDPAAMPTTWVSLVRSNIQDKSFAYDCPEMPQVKIQDTPIRLVRVAEQ
jgi:hypothetical protein